MKTIKENVNNKETVVKKNMSPTDGKIRTFVLAPIFAILGVVALVAGWSVFIAIVLFVLAGIMVWTGRSSSCPIYSATGMSTKSDEEAGVTA